MSKTHNHGTYICVLAVCTGLVSTCLVNNNSSISIIVTISHSHNCQQKSLSLSSIKDTDIYHTNHNKIWQFRTTKLTSSKCINSVQYSMSGVGKLFPRRATLKILVLPGGCIYSVFWHFSPSGWEFLVQILHAYYMFLSTLEYKF